MTYISNDVLKSQIYKSQFQGKTHLLKSPIKPTVLDKEGNGVNGVENELGSTVTNGAVSFFFSGSTT